MKNTAPTSQATFGAGCFWGVEETFRQVPGVLETAVGFMGGNVKDVTYEQVCHSDTNHAEVVHMTYDPAKVSYEQLLDIFWSNHNPTLHNRQGPDIGSQYRSVIFFHTPEQEKIASASKEALTKSGKWRDTIVTQIVPAEPFYKADEHHQKYLMKRGLGSCHI